MTQPSSAPLPGGGIELTLDRPRILRLDFRAYVALEKATGKNPLKGDFWQDFDSPGKLAATLWAALLHEDKALTLDQATALITTDRLGEIAAAVAEAVSQSMPKKKEEPPAAA